MLEPEMEQALNRQINWEQAASQEYLAMAAYFEAVSLRGFAKFMRKQSAEEGEHAMRLFDHVCDRGGRVSLGAVAKPPVDFDSARAVFEAARARERSNTRSIHELYRLAEQRGDLATRTMLHWFIDEQVEEEQWCDEALALLEMVGDNRSALLMLDRRYGELAGKED
jgi:ferritin